MGFDGQHGRHDQAGRFVSTERRRARRLPIPHASRTGPTGPDTETAMAKVTVADEDITDLQLVTSKPVSVAGRVIVDPAAAQSLPASLFVTAFPMDGPEFRWLQRREEWPTTITFELKTAPGRSRISLSNPPAGWSIRAVRLNGADVIDSGIEFKPNQNVRGLEVELTNKVSVVTGLVTTGRGEASKRLHGDRVSAGQRPMEGHELALHPDRPSGSGRPIQDLRAAVRRVPVDRGRPHQSGRVLRSGVP